VLAHSRRRLDRGARRAQDRLGGDQPTLPLERDLTADAGATPPPNQLLERLQSSATPFPVARLRHKVPPKWETDMIEVQVLEWIPNRQGQQTRVLGVVIINGDMYLVAHGIKGRYRHNEEWWHNFVSNDGDVKHFRHGFEDLHYHLEAQVAALMRCLGAKEATLYSNHAPCWRSEPFASCTTRLRHMLPEGSRLTVYAKDEDGVPFDPVDFDGVTDHE
jgi:hypothetical protein